MLKSMTAYSRSVLVTPLGRFVAEIHSVNRKHLEISTHLPKSLLAFDSEIKKWISSAVHRGQVNVRLHVSFENAEIMRVTPNLALAKQLKDAWTQIAAHLDVPPSQFNLGLIAEKDLFIYEEELPNQTEIKDALHTLFQNTLNQLLEMKVWEGKELGLDIAQRLVTLKTAIDVIQARAPDAVEKYQEKLYQKLQQTVQSLSIDIADERLMKEVCLFADKVDIAEEITRFNSHVSQFQSVLNSHLVGMGKTLEFLVQELNREINTIGSKSADVEIARLVITVKTELERIREQIQNVE